MGRMKQLWIAENMGANHTLYGVMKAMGLPLSPEQEEFQDYLERRFSMVDGEKYLPKEECKLEDCDCLRKKLLGDETWYICELNETLCLVEYGSIDYCDEWRE